MLQWCLLGDRKMIITIVPHCWNVSLFFIIIIYLASLKLISCFHDCPSRVYFVQRFRIKATRSRLILGCHYSLHMITISAAADVVAK